MGTGTPGGDHRPPAPWWTETASMRQRKVVAVVADERPISMPSRAALAGATPVTAYRVGVADNATAGEVVRDNIAPEESAHTKITTALSVMVSDDNDANTVHVCPGATASCVPTPVATKPVPVMFQPVFGDKFVAVDLVSRIARDPCTTDAGTASVDVISWPKS